MSLRYLSTINSLVVVSLFQRHMQDEVVSLSGSASVRLKCTPCSPAGEVEGNRKRWLVLSKARVCHGARMPRPDPTHRTVMRPDLVVQALGE